VIELVPGIGLEPISTSDGGRDFKSLVSTNFTIRAIDHPNIDAHSP
jgi:hypothetical protein